MSDELIIDFIEAKDVTEFCENPPTGYRVYNLLTRINGVRWVVQHLFSIEFVNDPYFENMVKVFAESAARISYEKRRCADENTLA